MPTHWLYESRDIKLVMPAFKPMQDPENRKKMIAFLHQKFD